MGPENLNPQSETQKWDPEKLNPESEAETCVRKTGFLNQKPKNGHQQLDS